MLKSYRSVKILFIVISLCLSLATLVLLLLYSYPYKIVVDEKHVLYDTRFNIYIDVDNDGISERITPYTHQLTDLTYITLNSAELKNDIGAYHLKRKISKNSQHFFDDYNGDKIRDLIIYTINMDTLFVSILDVKKEHEYIDELPLIVRTPLFNKQWDLDRVRGNLYDFDNDGKLELLTCIRTAHSVPMRGFIIYDFEENKITSKFLTAQAVTNYYINDFNNDSNAEILYTTTAPGNFDKNLRHNDWESRFMILNSKLELIYESEVLGVYPSSTGLSIIDIENEPRIFITAHQNKKNEGASIIAFNNNLEELNKVTFPEDVQSVSCFVFKDKNKEILLAVINKKETKILRIYDKNLQILKEKEFDGSLIISTKSYFLNNDDKLYFIGGMDDNLFIMNTELELLALDEIPAEVIDDDYYLSIGYANNTNHFLTRKNNIQTYSHLERSFIHSYIIPISMLSFPVFYFLLLFFNSIIHYVKKYSDSLKYLINQENNNVILIDHEGILKEYNPQIISRLRFDNNESGDSILTKIPKNTVLHRLAYDAIHNRITKPISEPVYNELGISEGELTVTPLKSMLGYVYAYLIRFEDRTKVIQHERNLIWASTAQKIAHDIKTPLSIIQLNLSSLKARIEQEFIVKKRDYFSDIEMIQDEIKRITRLTKDFLKFSNLEKPNFQAVELKEIIESTKNNFSSYFGNGISIEIDIGKNAEYILADPNQIEQLLQIFIENAIDALNGNGTIRIKTEVVINFKNLSKESVCICISDNGSGIEEEKVARIFEPYFTTKIEGTGLGLAIANKIAMDNKGRVEVESEPGKGTIFKVIFPKFTY